MKHIHRTKFKRIISGMLAAAMSISLFATVPVSAETGKTTYTYDGYSVEYNVTNEWEGNQTVEITVSNTGDESILNWALKYDAEGEISNLWNANIYEQTESDYVIKNVGWNYEIAPNQSVVYGYTLSGENISVPETFEIYSKRVDVTEGYDVKCNYNQVWDTGVQGELVITNTSDTPIEAWTLSFDTNFTINNLWNGRILENTDTSYVVSSQMWTNPIQANGSTTIGFVGTKTADIEALLNNFKLTAVVIGEGIPVIPVDPPEEKIEITANAEYNEESGNVTVSWITTNPNGIFDILMSPDGENFTSVGTVENVSEFVYTPATDFDAYHFKVVQTVGEQFVESNVVSVVKPVEDIVITAEAVYDEDSGNVTVKWTTTNPNGTFDILMSSDGENFTSVGAVENSAEFVYAPDEFETLYFKVKQTTGEQIAESNVVSVVKSVEDIAISAEAVYDEESGNITVKWTTSSPNGAFDILMSANGESFDSVGLVENAVEFVYTPDEFETLYFKVKQTTGKQTAESNTVTVNYSIDWSDSTDTDNDGLKDVYEKHHFETDPENADTDDDGLLDGYEVYYLGTEPKEADSDSNDVSDGDEDFDSDGLNNLREYELGTDPNNADSDSDGLTDFDEVNTYNTDPLKYDTDDDSISDSDEVALGLNPNSASTDGVSDSERTFVQHIGADSDNFAAVNTDENPFKVSIDITAAGVAANNLSSRESGYSNAIKNDAILGISPEFVYTEGLKVEDVVINFDIDSSATANVNGSYTSLSDEFAGIKRLNVFKYFEDVNMLLPIETFHDVENNRVYTHVDELGTYCLMDMEVWLEGLEITSEETVSNEVAPVLYSARATSVDEENNEEEKKCLDVVLIAYPNKPLLDTAKSELRITCKSIFEQAEKENIDARIYFVSFLGTSIETPDGNIYASNYEEAEEIINRHAGITPALGENSYALYKALNHTANKCVPHFRESSDRFCFVVDVCGFPRVDSGIGAISTFNENNVRLSFSYNAGNTNALNYALLSTGACEEAVIGNGRFNFEDFIIREIFGEHENEYPIISAVGWKRINLDAPITEEYRNHSLVIENDPSLRYDIISNYELADTDCDELFDFEEIMFETRDGNDLISFDSSGNAVLPNFEDCTGALPWNRRIFYVEEGLRRYADVAKFQDLYKLRVLPIKSDPTSEDSDGDDIADEEETFIGTSCLSNDTDKDGLDDCTEYVNWYDPLDPNPDGDIYSDYEEFINGTNPYAVDFTAEAWAAEFLKGVIEGDFIEEPSIPALVGQIAGGIAPGVGTIADVRDTIVNASRGDWGMAAMSAVGIVPVGGDLTKTAANITQFIAKKGDDASQIAELIITFSKRSSTTFSRSRASISFDDLTKIVPASSLDELIEAFGKSNKKISREFYLQVAEVAKKEGKKIPTILDDFPEAAIKNVETDLWELGWFERGDEIDRLLKNNLGHNYPTYDHIDEASGLATSVKSIDPMCKTYKDTYEQAKGFERRLERCRDQLLAGKSEVVRKDELGNIISKTEVKKRALHLVFPDVPLTADQEQVLRKFISDNKDKIDILITVVKT